MPNPYKDLDNQQEQRENKDTKSLVECKESETISKTENAVFDKIFKSSYEELQKVLLEKYLSKDLNFTDLEFLEVFFDPIKATDPTVQAGNQTPQYEGRAIGYTKGDNQIQFFNAGITQEHIGKWAEWTSSEPLLRNQIQDTPLTLNSIHPSLVNYRVLFFESIPKQSRSDKQFHIGQYGKLMSLDEALSRLSPEDKNEANAISCGLTNNFSREKVDWIKSFWVALDYDKITIDYREIKSQIPYGHIYYPSHSNGKDGKYSFRLLFPLSEGITKETVYRQTAKFIAELIESKCGAKCDEASFKVCQIWYTPTNEESIEYHLEKWEGKKRLPFPLLEPQKIIEENTPNQLPQEQVSKKILTNSKVKRNERLIAEQINDPVAFLIKEGYKENGERDGKRIMHHSESTHTDSVEVNNNGTMFSHHSPNQEDSRCLVADTMEYVRLKEKKPEGELRPVSISEILEYKYNYLRNKPILTAVKAILDHSNMVYEYDTVMKKVSFTRNGEIKNLRWEIIPYFFDNKEPDAEKMAEILAEKHPYNSIQRDIESYEWDDIQRISSFLTDYAGLTDSWENRLLSHYIWDGILSKLYKNFFPHAIYMTGEEGIGKSLTCRLLGGRYYTGTPADVNEDEIYLQLRRKLIVSDEESSQITRKNLNKIRGVITSDEANIRQKYDADMSEFNLIGILCFISNDKYILNEAGHRRDIVFEFKKTTAQQENIEKIKDKEDRLKLWEKLIAEELHYRKNGYTVSYTDNNGIVKEHTFQPFEEVILLPELDRYIKELQKCHAKPDPDEEKLVEYIKTHDWVIYEELPFYITKDKFINRLGLEGFVKHTFQPTINGKKMNKKVGYIRPDKKDKCNKEYKEREIQRLKNKIG